MSKIDYNSSLSTHRKNMKALNEKHKNELEKVRINHTKQKNQLELSQAKELVTKRSEGHKKLIDLTHRQEKTLEKLKESMEKTKATAIKREDDVLDSIEKSVKNQKLEHHEKTQIERAKHDMAMNELHQKAQIEMNRLQREINSKKQELSHTSKLEVTHEEAIGEKKLSMTKKSYLNKKNASEDKYQRALAQQKKNYQDLITKEERKFQSEIVGKTKNFQDEIKRIKADGTLKNQKTQALFEKKFQELQKSNEALLKKLISKKSEIIQKLRNEVLETHTLDAQKVGDPFYAVTGLDPIIEKEADHYLVKLEVSEEAASEVELNGHKRDITLSMNRRFENTSNEDSGVQKLKRVETLTKNFSVDQIINENEVEKSYKDGVLTFKVMLA